MWDPNLPGSQRGRNAVNLGLSLIVASPLAGKATNLINKGSVANNAAKQGFKIEGQLVQIWSERKLFVNWLKGNYSAGGTTLNLTQAKQVIENARNLGITRIDLNKAGQLGEEITGATAGIRHFKIENIHIYIKEFKELLK